MFTHLFVLNRKYGIQAHCTNTKIKTKKSGKEEKPIWKERPPEETAVF